MIFSNMIICDRSFFMMINADRKISAADVIIESRNCIYAENSKNNDPEVIS